MKVSEHGEYRTRKRLGVSKKIVQREVDKAWVEGTRREEFSGRLRRYLDYQYHYHNTHSVLKIYNGNLYIFRDGLLITMWPLPQRYRNSKALKSDD